MMAMAKQTDGKGRKDSEASAQLLFPVDTTPGKRRRRCTFCGELYWPYCGHRCSLGSHMHM